MSEADALRIIVARQDKRIAELRNEIDLSFERGRQEGFAEAREAAAQDIEERYGDYVWHGNLATEIRALQPNEDQQ